MSTNRPQALTGNDEWYTPAKYVESARKLMGGIDFDPASNAIAQATVKAKAYGTIDTDSLRVNAKWRGSVWMNPPYSNGLCVKFIERLVAEYAKGNVTEAVVLVNSATDTGWAHTAFGAASAVCFTKGRIKFLRPDGTQGNSPAHGQMFLYFGPNPQAFKTEFGQYGSVMIGLSE